MNIELTISMHRGLNPPKPNLVLRVGITGHRPKPYQFPHSSIDFVEQKLRDVFAHIDDTLVKFARKEQNGNDVYSHAPHAVRLVCGLAEGADQIAAAMKPAQWALDAILPFPRDDYATDFKRSAAGDEIDVTAGFKKALAGATTTVELPNSSRSGRSRPTGDIAPDKPQDRSAAYARLGGFLLRQVDVLIAVWDGKREEGPGGTATVVKGAIEAGIPVIWISTLENTIARMVIDIDDDERPVAPEADCLGGLLTDAIRAVVSPPINTYADQRLNEFFRESWPLPSRWISYDLLKRLAEAKPIRFKLVPETIDHYAENWAPLTADGPKTGHLGNRIADILVPRYAWADALAVDFSHHYRSTYVNAYLLATGAVFIALFGLFGHDLFHQAEAQLAFKCGLVTLELILITTVVRMVLRGRKSRWQEKWVEYRALAEMLRDARFLALIGEHGRAQRNDDLEPKSSAWFLWYLRATIREVGLPDALLNGTYQQAVLNTVDKHVVEEQIVWHKANAATLHRIHHWLHTLGDICFLTTGGLLAVFFLGWLAFAFGIMLEGKVLGAIVGFGHDHQDALGPIEQSTGMPADARLGTWLFAIKNWITFAAAFLPALGAALAGIRETGDFEKFSDRSAKTAASLEELQRDLALARRRLRLDTTGDVLLSAAQVLTEDLADWHMVYGHKRLDLPV
ncbi:hypothetical protein [Bradyrhizobium prioriisuperbiae]|uniref:hypothetical protein n=1 Tax=Bradyrhizobium prioriisuperbiae TaxID=2854389 RepID=UPI0028EE9697|nr:hypothetical protein [Bradyrhizobium prioritasuperba]